MKQGRRYSLFYAPAGTAARWSKPRNSRHLNIYSKEGFIEELADGRAALLRQETERLKPIEQTCEPLRAELL